MKKLLFICLGNICRSPMAEYLMRDIAAKRGLMIEVDSAGTSGWHDGEQMHCGTADVLDGLGIDSHDFRSSKVPKDALSRYDYLIVMDDNNLRDVMQQFGQLPEKIWKITDLLPSDSPYNHVPDPWYTGNFQETHRILSQCCERIADKIQQGAL